MKKILLVCTSVTLITLGFVSPLHAQTTMTSWVPPVGIPAPSFGIMNTAPATPATWAVPTANFYYVDETAAGSTDTSNPNGTPKKPRRTIPIPLPAGAVVEVHGTYSFAHTSPRGIVANGTAASPVYIRGVSATNHPIATSCWEATGSYLIVENFEFAGCGSFVFLDGSNHVALRNSDVHGTLTGGGVGVVSWKAQKLTDVVLFRNTIHDNGDVHASYDQDVHGIAVGSQVSNLWVLENQMYRNSGDGIQINAGTGALQPTTNHIYVGRNISHDNKQTGFWTKQAVDVIFSENQAYNHHPSNSSMGACMGGQYAPEHVWYINNKMWNCDNGIQLASGADQGYGQYQFFIGNQISHIHDSIGTWQAGSSWQNCGISLPGGTYRYVLENTMYDVDSGVCVAYAAGQVYMFDNVIQQVRPDGNHIIVDSTSVFSAVSPMGNLFAPNYRVNLAGNLTVVSATSKSLPNGANGVVTDVGFVSPSTGDFRLQTGSLARKLGVMNQLGIWEYFKSRYGLSISVDANGVARTATSVPDSGATQN